MDVFIVGKDVHSSMHNLDFWLLHARALGDHLQGQLVRNGKLHWKELGMRSGTGNTIRI